MVWSNWQGAIWRGAMLVVLFWSGLAWTQTQTQPSGDGAERIMVVHANGMSTRCRVLQSWKTDDGRMAHLLQAVQTNEKITIVDETVAGNVAKNAPGVPKRIFAWGVGIETPPEGSPLPPRQNSGAIQMAQGTLPSIPSPGSPPMIVNNTADDKALSDPKRIEITVAAGNKPLEPQVIDFKNAPVGANTPAPMIVNQQPKSVDRIPLPKLENAPPSKPIEIMQSKPIDIPQPKPIDPSCQTCESSTNMGSANRPPLFPRVNAMLARPEPPIYVSPPMPNAMNPGTPANVHEPLPGTPGSMANPIVVTESTPQPRVMEPVRRGWRPGDLLFGWMRSPTPAPVVVTGSEPKLTDPKYLALENKIAEKRLADRLEKMPKAPFSTAMSTANDAKKPEPVTIASLPKDDKPVAVAPPKEEPKTEKRDMWGLGASDRMPPPGKSLVDPQVVKLPPPPSLRKDDPLTAPERLLPSDDRLMPRGAIMAPVPTVPAGWPVGTQSVVAAKSGLIGPVTYIPVPTVTVPQPNHPPVPPPPAMPEAPQLNAYVNAFSPPPAPKAPAPTAASMPQWMQPNPAMVQQQQQMYQQQLMQQQMLQQQILMAYGHRPNPYMQPYSMPSQGPMTNGSPQYAGPLPPQNPFMPPMNAGYMPGYPPMQPMQPNPALQTVGYQQPAPTQQQVINQQIEQLIKLMRESPYPSQREVSAQSLTSFEWRVHPQIVPALLQAASQDPAASVRVGCVSCLGRMGAAVEPVMATLQTMRNDIDPRVRQEVEQTLGRLGQMQR